uniref:Uncharacterized protein n=1 Tax=Leersia perrieri TaxID=77586 RepID=A0A0D9XPM1_9ORYZ
MTVAYLKKQKPTTPLTSSFGSGLRSVGALLLGAGTGSRPLSYVGNNGVSRSPSGSSRSSRSRDMVDYDGKGTYIIFNVSNRLLISDLNANCYEPVKSIHFSNYSAPLCHAFDSEAKDGHDLIVGLLSGDVRISLNRCTGVAWVPGHEGFFVVSNADGNLYVYDKSKDGNTDWAFPTIDDQSEMMISHAKSSKSNPVARWHICQGAVNAISFSPDGAYLATVGRDGYLRVFDFAREQLIFGGKSYFGALLCCSWSMDGKYLLSGGEDDLVQVWSMDDRKMVKMGEGHKSWVSAVAFDPYWSPPNPDKPGGNTMYRFASVGQDAQLLLWDLTTGELTVPLSGLSQSSSSSPTSSSGSPSTDRDKYNAYLARFFSPSQLKKDRDTGILQPSPGMQEILKLSPLVEYRVGVDPLSTLEFTSESILTVCREGRITPCPRDIDSETDCSELFISNATSNERAVTTSSEASCCRSSFKQPSAVRFM